MRDIKYDFLRKIGRVNKKLMSKKEKKLVQRMAVLALLVTLALFASNYIVFDDFENKSKAFNFL